MSADKIAIGVRLRRARKGRGWDRPEMARRLAAALTGPRVGHESLVSYLKRWEAGKTGVSERYRLAYARALGLDEEQLFHPLHSSPWHPPTDADTLEGALTPEEEERLRLATQQPARVDRGVLDALTTVLAGQRRLEDAIGPAALVVPVGTQLEHITAMLRETNGPHRRQLGRIAAEWSCYTGWLHAALRSDARALDLFGHAEELADEFEDGTIAQIATGYRGHVARQQGRHRAVVRAACAALATPGGHPSQQIFLTLQLAQAYAELGERERGRRLVNDVAERAMDPPEPPPVVYWTTAPYFQIYTGLVLGDLRAYRDAADLLRTGIEGMPADQREAAWMREYEDALTLALDHA